MKLKRIITTLFFLLFLTHSVSLFSFNYSTDFNDLDKTFFLIYDHGGYSQTPLEEDYSLAKIENGILKLPVTETDHGPEMVTKGIYVDENSVITAEWKVKVHYANEYFSGNVGFYLTPDSTFYNSEKGDEIHPYGYWDDEENKEKFTGIFNVIYHNYFYGNEDSPYYGDEFTVCGYKNCIDVKPIWDEWFTTKVEINLHTKKAKAWINGNLVGEFNINPDIDLQKLSYLKIHFSPYGWWTGHEMDLDYFKIDVTDSNDNESDNNGGDTTNTSNVCADNSCATFNFESLMLNVPCLKINDKIYKLGMKIVEIEPDLIFNLIDIDEINNSSLTSDSNCSTFNFLTMSMNIPCLELDNELYSIDLKIIGTQPILLKLTGVDNGKCATSEDNNTDNGDINTGDSDTGEVKTITLSTKDVLEIDFVTGNTGTMNNPLDNFSLWLEPWCTDKPGLCGNFVDIGEVDVNSSNIQIPANGYISDEAGYDNCVEVTPGHTFINKNYDGSYTVFKIESHEKPDTCEHTIEIEYRNL